MSIRRIILGTLLCLFIFGSMGYLVWSWIRSTRPEVKYARGIEAIEKGDYLLAESIGNELERSRSRDLGNLLLGRLFLKQARFSKALTQLNQISDRDQIRLEAAYYVGEIYQGMGRLFEAEQSFHFVLTENPDHVDSHRQLAVIYYDQGDFPRAVQELREVTRLDEVDARPWRMMGIIYTQLDQPKLAVEALESALTRKASEEIRQEIRVEQGDALLKLFRYDDAERSIEGVPGESAALIRGEIYRSRNQLQKAYQEIEPWLTPDSRNPAISRLQGKIFTAEEKFSEAATAFERAVALDPSDYPTQFQLGEAYARAGEKQAAEKQQKRAEEVRLTLRKVVDLSEEAMKNPWDPAPRLKLAENWKTLGKPELELMWRRAAAACPSVRKN